MLALVVAYRKTEISQYHEVIYADVTRHLIDNATNTLAGGLGGPDGVAACTARALQNLPLTPIEDLARDNGLPWPVWDPHVSNASAPDTGPATPDPDSQYQLLAEGVTWEQVSQLQQLAAAEFVQGLAQGLGLGGANGTAAGAGAGAGGEGENGGGAVLSQLAECGDKASRTMARTLLDTFWLYINLKGPLPVLTFDEFVLLARTLDRAMGMYPGVQQVLYNFKRDFGWNWLGNLVGLGGLAFTPATPEVLRFAQHMSRTHAFFDDVFIGVYDNPDELWRMASQGYRFWAVVHFASGPTRGSPGGADYAIRMPLLETPETFVPIDKFAHRTSRKYKMYVTSGFVSIQNAINGYVMGLEPSQEASLLVPRQPGRGGWNQTAGNEYAAVHNATEGLKLQEYNTWFGTMPKPAYRFNKFYEAVGPMLGLLLCLSLIFPLAMLTRGMVEEKELRQRELLLIMGLSPGPHVAAWAVTYLAVFLAVSCLSVAVAASTFLPHASPSLLLTYYACFAAAEVAFGVMLSTLFTRAKVAAVVAPLAHFAFAMPRYVFFRTGSPQALAGKYAVCLLAPSAFTFGADLIAQYEDSGSGLQWSNLWSDDLPFGACCLLMALDALLYSLVAWYLGRVIPQSPGGTCSPWYFPLLPLVRGLRRLREGRVGAGRGPSYQQLQGGPPAGAEGGGVNGAGLGFGAGSGDVAMGPLWHGAAKGDDELVPLRSGELAAGPGGEAKAAVATAGARGEAGGAGGAAGANTQTDPSDPRVAVVMDRLHKRYPTGLVAVRELSLTLRSGEMTALLGHNGAGKSTTIAMLTGLVAPTAGDATVGGASITSATQEARLSIGLCPQHNVLFAHLTVLEHLELVAAIKGVPGSAACRAAAQEMAGVVGLGAAGDAGALSKNLSGGMKRKLQVGMALIGGSRVVVLDEPSAGMCPSARRGLWGLLRRVKADSGPAGAGAAGGPGSWGAPGGRALLMSTHHLEEADVLADKVAIMASGQLCAYGTPLELKQRHAGGYFLHLNRTPELAGADPGPLLEAVAGRVPGARLARAAGGEVVLRLPLDAAPAFPSLFDYLDDAPTRRRLGVSHFGLSMPSMEEVFLATTQHTSSQGGGGVQRTGSLRRAMSDKLQSVGSASKGGVGAVAAAVAGVAKQLSVGRGQGSEVGYGRLGGEEVGEVGGKGDAEVEEGLVGGGEGKGGAGQEEERGEDRGMEARVDAPRGSWRHAMRCLRLMVWKRSCVTLRDIKGLAWLFLLPIVAIGLTLLVLTANIDPTGPSLLLSLRSIEQFTPVPVSHSPAPLLLRGCLGPATPPPASYSAESKSLFGGWMPKAQWGGRSTCPLGIEFRTDYAADGWMQSRHLLADIAAGHVPQYGAAVWDDPMVLQFKQDLENSEFRLQRTMREALDVSGADLRVLSDYTALLGGVPGGPEAVAGAVLSYTESLPVDPEAVGAWLRPLLGLLPQKQGQGPRGQGGRRRMQSADLVGEGCAAGGEADKGGVDRAAAVQAVQGLRRLRRQLLQQQGPGTGTGGHGERHADPAAPRVDPTGSWGGATTGTSSSSSSSGAQQGGAGGSLDLSSLLQGDVDLAALADQLSSLGLGSLGALGVDLNGLMPGGVLNATLGGVEALVAALQAMGPQEAADTLNALIGVLAEAAGVGDGQGGVDLSRVPGLDEAKGFLPAGLMPNGTSSSGGSTGAQLVTPAVAAAVQRLAPAVLALAAEAEAGSVDFAAAVKGAAAVRGVVSGLWRRFQQMPVTLMFNGSSWHSSMAVLVDMQQALACINNSAVLGRTPVELAEVLEPAYQAAQEREAAGGSGPWLPPPFALDRHLRVTNHPLPLTAADSAALDTFLTVLAAIFVLVPFCYLAGAYAVAPVSEARCGSKALQLGAGCPPAVYWAGHAAFDAVVHAAVTAVALATFAAFGDGATCGSAVQAVATFLLLLGYGLAVAPLSYACSLPFNSPSAAQVSVSALCFLLGFMFVVGNQVMKDIPETQELQRTAVHWCRLLPPFNLGEGLINMAAFHLITQLRKDLNVQQDLQDQFGTTGAANGTTDGPANKDSLIPEDAIPKEYNHDSPFDWAVAGRNLAALYGGAVLYFILVVVLDRCRTDPHWAAALAAAWRAVTAPPRAAWLWLAGGGRRRYGSLAGCFATVRASDGVMYGALVAKGAGDAGASGSGGEVALQELGGGGSTANGGGGGVFGGGYMDVEAAALLPGSGGGAGGAAVGGGGYVEWEEPEAVAAERRRVEVAGAAEGDALCVQRLRKVYPTRPPKVALHCLSLGVRPGERFGFLGANGAGKSTALSILCGQQLPSGGRALVAGHDVAAEPAEALARTGYCPQTDPLLEHLSAREQLLLVCGLRGLPPAAAPRLAARLLARCALPPAAWDAACGTLSGGNKRKVALATALVGQPAACLLDEPSAGMDPGARRAMWDAILRATKPHHQQGPQQQQQQQQQQPVSLVLTTHYMDEAEALCERVGIMKAGRLVCLGAPQELKSTYGTEYELELQMDERRTAEAEAAAVNGAEANGHGHVGAGGSGAMVTAAWAAGPAEEGVAGPGGQLLPASRSLSRGSGGGSASLSLGAALAGTSSSAGLWGAASLTPAHSAVSAAAAGAAAAAAAAGGPACVSVEEVVCQLAAAFPGARLLQRDEEGRHARVALPARGLALGRVFQYLEQHKSSLGLLSYAVSQPSLEQVFLAVAGGRIQEDGGEEEEGEGGGGASGAAAPSPV